VYILQPYDDALKFILKNGERRKNRTGVDTLSVFSIRSVYEIEDYFPVVTKRKVYPNAAFAELLWMLSGSTNNDDLVKLGAKFWTPWVDLSNPENVEFYKRTGFEYPHLGPVYGWQMRYFGAEYPNKNGGVDQISWLVNEIKNNPSSRRLIVSLWNPKDLHLMRLLPCHYCFHIDIDNQGRMTLLQTQRSSDMPIGIPANICFYSALCYMLAQQTGYRPYRLIHHTEDSHIYMNQIEQVEEYLSRPETNSPRLNLKTAEDIFSYKLENFEIKDYNPQLPIRIPVLV
jgi:thymidylate synthase